MEKNKKDKESIVGAEDRENLKTKGIRHFVEKRPFLTAVLLSVAAGAILSIVLQMGLAAQDFVSGDGLMAVTEIFAAVISGAVVYGGFLIFPFVLTVAELILLVKGRKNQELYRKGRMFDIVGIVLGVLYSLFYLSISREVLFGMDWQQQLVNRQTHTPVYTESQLTVIAIMAVAVLGYFIVNFIPLRKMPPLTLVLGMAAMYLGVIESVVWGIQVFHFEIFDFFLLLLPLNCLILTARTVSRKMWEWKELHETDDARREFPEADGMRRAPFETDASPRVRYEEGGGVLCACNRFLAKSERWPLAAFLLMWPLLGVLIGILILFGQRPDAVIRAFTETSDWNLSQRVAPQNLYYDEHYLCTVAAGGHERIVKPKRLGVRHGHQVIVNRQLCVANAFEQILEERTPRFHKAVRHVYDTYGFPVAKLIHSKYTADVVYFVMKPLEWAFLAVLYLADVNPENRIAIQYTGKRLEDFVMMEDET